MLLIKYVRLGIFFGLTEGYSIDEGMTYWPGERSVGIKSVEGYKSTLGIDGSASYSRNTSNLCSPYPKSVETILCA